MLYVMLFGYHGQSVRLQVQPFLLPERQRVIRLPVAVLHRVPFCVVQQLTKIEEEQEALFLP